MNCPKCGSQLDKHTIKCQICGARIGRFCPVCKEYNLITNKNCTSCGEVLLKICPKCKSINLYRYFCIIKKGVSSFDTP